MDDYTRLACSETLSDEKGTTVAAFTARALHAFQQKGITHITENMTDNHRPATASERKTTNLQTVTNLSAMYS